MSIKQAITDQSIRIAESPAQATAFSILAALSVCHLLNDLIQSLLPAVYPLLKASFRLSFAQIGVITFVFQVSASLLQPMVGHLTDKRPRPYSLVAGMGMTFAGLLIIAMAPSFPFLLLGAGVMGTGSSVFHPESSRMARLASGGRHGLAQSLFQVGGNTGSSLGPLLAAFVVVRNGQHSLSWFAPAAAIAMVLLANIAGWYKTKLADRKPKQSGAAAHIHPGVTRKNAGIFVAILLVLVFSKYFYLASITSYYTFYLIHRFHVTVPNAQLHLFAFLAAVALGTIIGGPVGDRVGRKYVIWASILGVLPFTLMMPYANLAWTGVLSAIIGFVLASAFSAIIVFAQELLPGRIGLISGLFFGFAFGTAGVGAAALGILADSYGIGFVYHLCSFLPAIGLLAAFLPNLDRNVPAEKLEKLDPELEAETAQ